jgi:hypothetical protein
VKLFGGPVGDSPRPPPAPTPPASSSPVDLQALIVEHPPIPVVGTLAAAAGGTKATLLQLLDIGIHSEDPMVRAQAVRIVVWTLEADPAMRSALIGQLSAMDDGALSNFLRGAAGDHAEEFTLQVLTQAQATEIRTKATSVLQRLRAGS